MGADSEYKAQEAKFGLHMETPVYENVHEIWKFSEEKREEIIAHAENDNEVTKTEWAANLNLPWEYQDSNVLFLRTHA